MVVTYYQLCFGLMSPDVSVFLSVLVGCILLAAQSLATGFFASGHLGAGRRAYASAILLSAWLVFGLRVFASGFDDAYHTIVCVALAAVDLSVIVAALIADKRGEPKLM